MQQLIGEVIAIGDELTTGQRVDTNTQWLSAQLLELGIHVTRHTTVSDDMDVNIDVFRGAARRADVVLVTGGLGPTADDLTRDALAVAAGVELVRDARSLELIEAMFERFGRDMPPQNRRQADFPAGAKAIDNNAGTAPGVDFLFTPKSNACHKNGYTAARFFCMPGVPVEMKQMWAESVRPTLETMTAEYGITRHYLVRCFGVGESRLEAMLPDLINRDHYPRVGITATQGTLTLRIVANEKDEAACYERMQPTLVTLRKTLGPIIFAEGKGDQGETELHSVVLDLLAEKQETVAVIDGATDGLLTKWLAKANDKANDVANDAVNDAVNDATNANGEASHCFLPSETATNANAQETLEELEQRAASSRSSLNADNVIVIGPKRMPSSPNEPVRVSLAVATPHQTVSKEVNLNGHESLHRPMAAKHALNLLRHELI